MWARGSMAAAVVLFALLPTGCSDVTVTLRVSTSFVDLSDLIDDPELVITINYTLPRAGTVTLSVHNEAGEVVQFLVRNVQQDAVGIKRHDWNLRDERGSLVGAGRYFINFSADYAHTTFTILLAD